MNLNYTRTLVYFLDKISENENISKERGMDLCGDLWKPISKELKGQLLILYGDGSAKVKQGRLNECKARYKLMLADSEKSEQSQTLSEKSMKSQISHNLHATIVAYIGLLLSIFSVLNQIFKWF